MGQLASCCRAAKSKRPKAKKFSFRIKHKSNPSELPGNNNNPLCHPNRSSHPFNRPSSIIRDGASPLFNQPSKLVEQNGTSANDFKVDLAPSGEISHAQKKRALYRAERLAGTQSLSLPDDFHVEKNAIPSLRKKHLSPPKLSDNTDSSGYGRLVEGTKEWLCTHLDPWVIVQYLQEQGGLDTELTMQLGRIPDDLERNKCLIDFAIATEERPGFSMIREALSLKPDARMEPILDFLQVVDSIIILIDTINSDVLKEQDLSSSVQTFDSKETLLSSGETISGISTIRNTGNGLNRYFRSDILLPAVSRPCLYETEERGWVEHGSDAANRDHTFTRRRHSALFHSDEPHRTGKKCELPIISISIYNIDLKSEFVNQLTSILVDSAHVRYLSIVRARICMGSCEELCRVFARKSSGLEQFDFRMNHLSGSDSMEQVVAGLRNASALRRLNLSSTGLRAEACKTLVQSLGAGSASNRALTELDLGYNELEDDGCCTVAELLEMPGCWMKILRLRNNGIGPSGMRRLATALRGHPRLTLLDISSNALGNDGASSLAEALLGNCTLRDVAIDDCSISAEGCRHLARALKTNTSLRSLTLSRNPLGDVGIQFLAEGFKYNRTLEVLGIDMCCIGNLGFVPLLQELRWCHSLRVVRACYNFIGIPQNPILTSGGCRRWSSASVQMSNYASAAQGTDHHHLCLDVYSELCEVLRVNPKLKIFMWGNKLADDVTSARTKPEVEAQKIWDRSLTVADSGYDTLEYSRTE